MTRRCQSCARLFPGDVCPGCGFDHVIHIEVTEAERCGLPSHYEQHANHGAKRATVCAYCASPILPGKGARRYCSKWCQKRGYTVTPRAERKGRRIADPAAIRRERAAWDACRSMADREALAARFGIRLNTLYGIVKRFGWGHARTGYKLDGSPLTASVNARGLNNWQKVPRPVGGSAEPIGRSESRPGSGRGTSPAREGV